MTQLKERLCVWVLYTKSLASLSAYTNSPPPATTLSLAASNLHVFAWFLRCAYPLFWLYGDAEESLPKQRYYTAHWKLLRYYMKRGEKNCSFIYFNYELIRWDVHKYQTHPLVHPWLEWRVLGVGEKRDEDVLVLWNFWTSMEKTYYAIAKRHEHLQYIAWGKDCIQAWNMELLDK